MELPNQRHPSEAPEIVGPAWLFRMFHDPTATSYRIVHNFLNLVIFVAAISGALETVDSLHDRFHRWFVACELVITLVFSLEYIGYVVTTRRKRDYIFSFWGMIDLLAILPTYLQLANITALKSTRVLRVLRVLKLAREAVTQLKTDKGGKPRNPVVTNLVIYFLALFSVVIISSTLIYHAEYGHGEVNSVQRVGTNTLRFTAMDLRGDLTGSKVIISGGSGFDGVWDVKLWDATKGVFELAVPDTELIAGVSEKDTPIHTSLDPRKKIRWGKETTVNGGLSSFNSVPQSMWWCVVTLTTVGYGDIYPVTLAGRLIAVVTMFCGLVLFGMLMNIVGKTMMVALFGTETVDDEATPQRRDHPGGHGGPADWNPEWRHCPTCGRAAADHVRSGPTQ